MHAKKMKTQPAKGPTHWTSKLFTPSHLFGFLQHCCPRAQPQALLSRAQHQQGAEHSGWSCGAMPLHCQPANGKLATATNKSASVGTNGRAKEWNTQFFQLCWNMFRANFPANTQSNGYWNLSSYADSGPSEAIFALHGSKPSADRASPKLYRAGSLRAYYSPA